MTCKSRSGVLYLLFLAFLVVSLITRTVFLVKSLGSLDPTPLLLVKVYGMGFLFDCVTFSYFAIPFVLYTLLAPDRVFRCRQVARIAGFVVSYLLLFNMVAEYVFFDEFGARYNFIAVDYLIYTTEVIRNIRESYPVGWVFGAILLLNIIIFAALRKFIDRACESTTTLRQRLKRGWILLALPLLAWLLVDLSWTSISPNNYANELAGNGLYSLGAAFRSNELDFERFYVSSERGPVLTRLKEMLHDEDETFLAGNVLDISRNVRPGATEMRLNVIVVVEESLSAEFLGCFGNKLRMTPNLDRLAADSMLFTNLYATGTRTVRGLEALALSMPPLPGSSVVKRPDNENLFSWGTVMQAKGYDTKFLYGGRGFFDNMNYFFSHNGFRVVDRDDLSSNEITFENAWGVCDEDLFRKVVTEANRSYARNTPFFSMVMTTSNHRPFTYPAGKVYVPSGSGREGGVMYADYALGRLMDEARKQPWFDRTLFVIVADHCASSARKIALPVNNYRIPLLIYCPALVSSRKVDTLASQIDVAPTVLGLLNFNYTSRFIGKDIMDDDIGPNRAFISTYEKLGFIEDDKLLVLSPKKGEAYYQFDRHNGTIREIPKQEALLRDALGYYAGTNFLYQAKTGRKELFPDGVRGVFHSRDAEHLHGSKSGT